MLMLMLNVNFYARVYDIIENSYIVVINSYI